MNTQTQWVHIVVLNGTTHSGSTRLMWLLLGGRPSGNPSALTDIRLRKQSGLDARTISAAHTRLFQAPLASCYGRPHQSCAAIPWLLLTNADISAAARLLYGFPRKLIFPDLPPFSCVALAPCAMVVRRYFPGESLATCGI